MDGDRKIGEGDPWIRVHSRDHAQTGGLTAALPRKKRAAPRVFLLLER
jgi:hypothetical protein